MESAVGEILDALLECCVITECRNNWHEYDNLVKEHVPNRVQSGSRVEGLSNYNDIDSMISNFEIVVVNHVNDISKDNDDREGYLMLDKENCYPGYVRLQGLKIITEFKDLVGRTIVVKSSAYFDAKKMMRRSVSEYQGDNVQNKVTLCGPAMQLYMYDMVPCFEIVSWPPCAKGFLKRVSVNAGKLSINEQRIRDIGCHVVPVSHPLSKDPDHEFRMSFSACEKYLLRNWTNKQMRCYFLCRELNKKYFSDVEKRICSYFWKTTILWLIEKESQEFWSQPYLECMKKILDKMSGYLKEKSCPNYFMPENLMMSTYTSEQCEQLQKIIEDVSKNLFLNILKCRNIKTLFGNDFEVMYSICEVVYSTNYAVIAKDILNKITVQKNKDFVKWKNFFTCINYIQCLSASVDIYSNLEIDCLLRYSIDNQHSQFGKCRHVYFKRYKAFLMLELSDNVSSSTERLELIDDALELLNSSIDMPGVLNDNGFSGYACKAFFYYCISNKEMAIESMTSCWSSFEKLPADSFTRSKPIHVCVPSLNDDRTPSYLKRDKILCNIFETLLNKCVTFNAIVLVGYLEYQFSGGKETLKLLKNSIKNLHGEHFYLNSKDPGNYFIFYKLGLLDKDSVEYKHFSSVLNE